MKTKTIIIFASNFLLLCGLFWFIKRERPTKEVVTIKEYNPYKNSKIWAVVIPSENNTFGYDIYVNDEVLIHQPWRPGLPGKDGFATEEGAKKVAELVIKKLRNNELPPSVTLKELQELGVLSY